MATTFALRGGPRTCLFCDAIVREVRCRCPRCPHTERLCKCTEVLDSFAARHGRCDACVEIDCTDGRPCPYASKVSGILPACDPSDSPAPDPSDGDDRADPDARLTRPYTPTRAYTLDASGPAESVFGAAFARSLGSGPHCVRCGLLRTAAICRCPGCTLEIPMCGCHDTLARLVTRGGYCLACEEAGCHDAWSCQRTVSTRPGAHHGSTH